MKNDIHCNLRNRKRLNTKNVVVLNNCFFFRYMLFIYKKKSGQNWLWTLINTFQVSLDFWVNLCPFFHKKKIIDIPANIELTSFELFT